MEKSRAHIFVSGIVQGVFFRASAVSEANRIGGLAGWARNVKDGRVEIVCEGDRAKVEKLIDWLFKGPEYSQVEDVEVAWGKATGEFIHFEIRP
ncbi:Acylphosphate phosphohydrolase, putative [hydrothermal vent metagenome]|uniref:Acylphosphate phosphohydrolase, putative n=1 Tax=hydrothermal vent metagenome TaxID=652676 RepID=A0A3B1BW01_9ZZZZ